MAPFRNRDRSNRSGRGQIEHNVLEGLPINQYREVEVTIGPNLTDNKPVDKNAWPELPMPRDSHLLPEHSQQILRAARSGRVYKPPAPPEDENEMKDEEEEHKEVQTGFTVKKFAKVARHLEVAEPEYLAKRRKGLPSPYVNGQVVQTALRETKVKKLDADGNVAVYKVLVPEGQAVEGEVQPTDAAIEVAPATAAPGTIVEGVGVVNAEGVVVANDILQQTPPRRRPPPPKKKRHGPGRKKKVVFAEGAADQGTPASNAGSDLLTVPGTKQDEGSVAPSDGGDTPMADVGGAEEEGSGEEGSEDEDHDMEATSTPATPLRLPVAPTSAPAPDHNDAMDIAPLETVTATEIPVAASVETSEPVTESEAFSLPVAEPAPAPEPAPEPEPTEQHVTRDPSSSPDLPLSAISHSRQNSLNQIPTSITTTEEVVPEPAPIESILLTEAAPIEPSPSIEAASITEPITEEHGPAPEPEAASIPPTIPSAPSSEPDLLGSLERQLEKDSEDMAGL